MPICTPCNEQDHERCDDVTRRDRHAQWVRDTYAPKKGKRGQKTPIPGFTPVGPAELRSIKANTPYDSCPCQHRQGTINNEEPPLPAHQKETP